MAFLSKRRAQAVVPYLLKHKVSGIISAPRHRRQLRRSSCNGLSSAVS